MADKDQSKNVMETGHGPPPVTGDQRGSKAGETQGQGPPPVTGDPRGSKAGETPHGPPLVTGDQRGSKADETQGQGPPSLAGALKGSNPDYFPGIMDPNLIINHQSMEIMRLRSELSLSSAKIKGYQTLSEYRICHHFCIANKYS